MQRTILIPLIVASALFMENMDSTVIATSLPAIAADIGQSPLALKLALTSYLVSLAVFIPVSGWVADRYGSRTVFASAIVVFVGGSLLCAVCSTLPAFVIARFIQGLGGALMVPVGRLVLMRAVPKSEYVAALNYLTIPALLGPVIGPALGGAITLYFHWRWIFAINVPIGALGLYLVLRHIPEFRSEDRPPFDSFGFALSGLGLAVLMLGLSSLGGHLMPTSVTLACVGAGALALVAYGWHARRTPHPAVDLRLFRLPTFFDGVLVGSLFRLGLGASPFLLPLLLQIGFGLDPLRSGLITCTTAVGAMFMKTLTIRILRRYGFRHVLTINGVLAALSVGVACFFTITTPHLLIALVLLISGCLRSLQFTALQAVSFAEIAPADVGQAASITSMAQRLSQSLGIAAGAYFLQLSAWLHGHDGIVASDFWPAFAALTIIALIAPLLHLRLAHDAGADVSGHRATPRPAA
ncbi:MAG: DHA2 family efflux MFS transporter permease subunit [Proteobacteria bacterium]|nr:DHA2 family efflux MFS transporter permease subunit [Pseudomonadota bacterium]